MTTERFKMSVYVSVVLIRNGKILLLKRSKHKVCGGLYAFPGGGVDGNEPVTTAAIREAQEEIGIKIDKQDLQFVHVFHFKRNEETEYINFFFVVQRWHGEPINNEPDKSDEIRWFDFQFLPEKMLDIHQHVFLMIQQNILFSEYGWD